MRLISILLKFPSTFGRLGVHALDARLLLLGHFLILPQQRFASGVGLLMHCSFRRMLQVLDVPTSVSQFGRCLIGHVLCVLHGSGLSTLGMRHCTSGLGTHLRSRTRYEGRIKPVHMHVLAHVPRVHIGLGRRIHTSILLRALSMVDRRIGS